MRVGGEKHKVGLEAASAVTCTIPSLPDLAADEWNEDVRTRSESS